VFEAGVKALGFKLEALVLRFKKSRVAFGDKDSGDKIMRIAGVLRGLLGWRCADGSVHVHGGTLDLSVKEGSWR